MAGDYSAILSRLDRRFKTLEAAPSLRLRGAARGPNGGSGSGGSHGDFGGGGEQGGI